MTKARRRDFAPQLSELWADEISIHRFWNQICPAVRTFFELCSTYPEADAVVLRKFRVRHYKMLCMTNVIQKLGHHASNLCFAGENDLSAQLLFHWIGFENLSRCCFLKSLQNLFPSFGSFSGGGHSTSTKGCACVSPQNAAWQKSSRNLDITHRICVTGTPSMDFFELWWNLTIGQKAGIQEKMNRCKIHVRYWKAFCITNTQPSRRHPRHLCDPVCHPPGVCRCNFIKVLL